MRVGFVVVIAVCWSGISAAVPIQFLVAEPPQYRLHDDAYIITIDSADGARLNHARALVDWVDSGADRQSSPGATIVAAVINRGGDGINRNPLASGQPHWSWHTVEPVDFVDLTIEILDGTPTMVEQDLDWWLDNTGGNIGFWNYTVVAELSAVPEPTAAVLAGLTAGVVLRRQRLFRSGRPPMRG